MTPAPRTSLFLMANLGAEVSRLISARDRGDVTLMQGALKRAEQMLTEISGLPDMQARAGEVEMLRGAIHSLVSGAEVSAQHIKSYFMPFALRLMSA